MHSSRLCVVGPNRRFFTVVAVFMGALAAAFLTPVARSTDWGALPICSLRHSSRARSARALVDVAAGSGGFFQGRVFYDR